MPSRMILSTAIVCVGAFVAPIAQQAGPPQQAPPVAGRAGGTPVQGAEEDLRLVAQFDRNGDRRLNLEERTTAREYLAAHPELRKPPRVGPRAMRPGTPGARVTPKDVRAYPASVSLYDPDAFRTLFIEFESKDWEQELAAFYHTDVEVHATLAVDGRSYKDVGISFRGNNSFTAVPEGLKRPLSITIDSVHDQDLLGHRSLNLLNANQDPSFLRSVIYLDVARDYIPSLGANFVQVVINGESWGVFVNQQTFSQEFELTRFKTTKGTRWKSPNNSTGGGFAYLGEDIALYRRWYEIKGPDNPSAWRALVDATRILHDTPAADLERALAPVMDLDAVLRFLALDMTLVNNDGYWRDGSDFNVYLTDKGRFLFTPHDANEGFRMTVRNGLSVQPDPLAAMDDPNKALRHKLLANPELRRRYLAYVGDIAEKWLDWRRLGPLVERYAKLIGAAVAADTRKHEETATFRAGIYGRTVDTPAPATSIKGFAEQRRAFLLAHPEVMKARGR